MSLFKSKTPTCCADRHCSEWARNYMKYCLCTRKDYVSIILGMTSVLSWGVAEVPQLITNYKEKSSEGLAIGFLLTWILGDVFNVLGCMLEPATLPTQYYMAVLYLITTLVLTLQSFYYGYFAHKYKRQSFKIESADKKRKGSHNIIPVESSVPILSKISESLEIPAADDNSSPEREYYISARSLSRSHTPTLNYFHSQKANQEAVQEPLLDGYVSGQSPPASETKTLLCVVFTVTMFLCTYNLKLERDSYLDLNSGRSNNGIVMQVGRKLLQVSGTLMEGGTGSNSIGTYLGWAMAFIYMGGRLPQIFKNFKRGNVQGLNPLMFIFALVGNATYVASILVSSMKWSNIKPNLPWVVESSGCVMLDSFILIQFIYFRYRRRKGLDTKRVILDP